ncbi:MAG: LTA synthase family protein [Pseudomonadota bacterium]
MFDTPRPARLAWLKKPWRRAGPVAPLLAFALASFALFALGRLALVWHHWPQINDSLALWRVFFIGARTDAIVIADALALPTLLTLLTPAVAAAGLRFGLTLYFTFFSAIFLFFEIASWPFLTEFQTRPNHLFFMYLSHPGEILGMLLHDFALVGGIGICSVIGIAYAAFLAMRALTKHSYPWPWTARLGVLPILLGVLFLGARSGLGEANANPSLAAFSNNFLVNQITLNATYSAAFAAYLQYDDAIEVHKRYGSLPRAEILSRIRDDIGAHNDSYTDAQRPTLRRQNAGATLNGKAAPNIVIIVEESLGAHMIGALGGKPVSPRFDALAKEGVFFTRLYATGERTYRGLEAVTAGYLPIDHGTSVLKQPMAQHQFFTLGALFKQHDYHTAFIYGGEGHFDNMAGFYLGNGFDHVYDRQDFVNAQYQGTWGVSDEDLFAKLDAMLADARNSPAFVVALTLSNHRPFDFPAGKIDLYEQPANTTFNSAKYADYALGKFFDNARTKDYYKSTLFLIVADHQWRIDGGGIFPLQEFHIPALLIGPALKPRVIDTLASQIDLPVTLLAAAGYEVIHPMLGRDLLHDTRPGRALIEHGNVFAYWQDQRLVVLPEYKTPQQYRISSNELIPMPLDRELHHTALAQIMIGDLLYQEKAYGLPPHTDDACSIDNKKPSTLGRTKDMNMSGRRQDTP